MLNSDNNSIQLLIGKLITNVILQFVWAFFSDCTVAVIIGPLQKIKNNISVELMISVP